MGRCTIVSGRDVIRGLLRMETKIGAIQLPKGWVYTSREGDGSAKALGP
jgi:hypothetical protein